MRPRRSPHRDGAGEKQAAALVALACSRKLLPLPAASTPRTVLTWLLSFPASRGCSLLLTRRVPRDRVRWTRLFSPVSPVDTESAPRSCALDAGRHLALTLALAVSQPRREPPGTSAVRRTPELLVSQAPRLSSLSCARCRYQKLNGHPAPTSDSLQLLVVPRCTALLGSPLPSPRQLGTVCEKRRAVPARLWPSRSRDNVGKSGSGWRRDCILEAKATYAEAERLDSPLPPRKPHPDGPLQQGSAREAAAKVAPQRGPGGRGALLTATAKRLPGPQAHAVWTQGANPTEPQSASQ
ncbi:hypothetical protein NDU88_004991 [Pleurodeles waltl]|uniref:Uncharacterized protein n=1 Tax=Pleurodeles waltl TaxID=8319 RepID=A0AAV7TT05_PLEWA|nr:hypothetical protein NDU88_004991 [Pleurodeles waltl]